MKKFIFLNALINCSIYVKAQDSSQQIIPKAYELVRPDSKSYAYPLFKPLTINYDYFGNTEYDTDYQDIPAEEGKLKSNTRLRVFANFPLYAKDKWIVTGSINYLHESFKTDEVINYNGLMHKNKFSVDDASFTLGNIYRNTLFNKPVIYMANLTLDSKDFVSVQRVRAMLGATIIVKRTANTAISTGIIGFIDPAAQIPVFPTFSYWHKFKNSKWEFDAILPAKLLFRRSNTFNGWLSLGTELNGNSFFNQNGISNMPGKYEFNYSEIWAGITYEHPLNKFILAGIKTGYKKTINSRMGEVNAKRKDYIMQTNSKAAPYVSLSLSLMIPKK